MAGQTPPDDPRIEDADVLLRKVAPVQMEVTVDGVTRLTSNAFHDILDRETGLEAVSVFVESRLTELGARAEDLVEGLEDYGVVALGVSAVRALGLGITFEPNTRSFGLAHAHINGDKGRSIRRRLASSATYRVWPDKHP